MQARLAQLDKENRALASNLPHNSTGGKATILNKKMSSKDTKTKPATKKVSTAAPQSKKAETTKPRNKSEKPHASRTKAGSNVEEPDDLCSKLMAKPVDLDDTDVAFCSVPSTTGDEQEEHLEANWYNGNSSAVRAICSCVCAWLVL